MLETYTIVIRSLPPRDGDAPEDCRLRTALKHLLRVFGFRCISIVPAHSGSVLAIRSLPPGSISEDDPNEYTRLRMAIYYLFSACWFICESLQAEPRFFQSGDGI